MKKEPAMLLVNRHLGSRVLNRRNVRFSNVNKTKPVWWLTIPQKMFTDTLHILLAKDNGRGLIWLRIEANSIKNPQSVFRVRTDKGLGGPVNLEIAAGGHRYMNDIKSGRTGYNFHRHIEYEWDE